MLRTVVRQRWKDAAGSKKNNEYHPLAELTNENTYACTSSGTFNSYRTRKFRCRLATRVFMISILVRSISAGPEDVEWPAEEGGEVVFGDILERAVDARVLMQFDA
jgi:hypothetical protein